MRLHCSCSILLLCLTLFHLLAAQPLQVYLLSPTWQEAELFELRDDLVEVRAPLDYLHQLVLSMYQLMQPTYNQEVARTKKHKKPPAKKPPPNKLVLNRLGFGNLSFTLGFSFNFELTNSVGFGGGNRQQSRLVLNPEAELRVN